ncbi:hypothetical protein SISNIDRAFT_253487 [Sistotremastrum niveocremeum HHB9708]|uniref:Uncharacterized protein n=1 Tax=Sistotremastrum niveocremeum HHB9708 TaxID=1314777 RepID=A0A164PIK9_9AGAM|nr:hypothetical protein SISNIDRAFT_253487 [Sistotremastrum niveocremeum HHB9708]
MSSTASTAQEQAVLYGTVERSAPSEDLPGDAIVAQAGDQREPGRLDVGNRGDTNTDSHRQRSESPIFSNSPEQPPGILLSGLASPNRSYEESDRAQRNVRIPPRRQTTVETDSSDEAEMTHQSRHRSRIGPPSPQKPSTPPQPTKANSPIPIVASIHQDVESTVPGSNQPPIDADDYGKFDPFDRTLEEAIGYFPERRQSLEHSEPESRQRPRQDRGTEDESGWEPQNAGWEGGAEPGPASWGSMAAPGGSRWYTWGEEPGHQDNAPTPPLPTELTGWGQDQVPSNDPDGQWGAPRTWESDWNPEEAPTEDQRGFHLSHQLLKFDPVPLETYNKQTLPQICMPVLPNYQVEIRHQVVLPRDYPDQLRITCLRVEDPLLLLSGVEIFLQIQGDLVLVFRFPGQMPTSIENTCSFSGNRPSVWHF